MFNNKALLAALLLLFAAPSWAQVPLTGAGKSATIPSYVGPGDIYSFRAWFGLRAYSAVKRGTAIANVCNSTGGIDVGCGDILSDATTGALVSATIGGITCPGTNCTIKTWYDQTGGNNCTGSCDVVQNTIANRFSLLANVQGSLPGAQSTGGGSATGMASAGNMSISQPVTFVAVAQRTSGSSLVFIIASNALNNGLGFNGVGKATIYNGSAADFSTTVNNSTTCSLQGMLNGASSSGSVNGTLSSGLSVSTTAANNTLIISRPNNSFGMYGYIFEAGVVGSDQSSNFTAMANNQKTYWGLGGSC